MIWMSLRIKAQNVGWVLFKFRAPRRGIQANGVGMGKNACGKLLRLLLPIDCYDEKRKA